MIDNPVDPSHYNKGGNQNAVIEFSEAVCSTLPGDEALLVHSILRYVSRYREKHPSDPTRDLRKAMWYLDRLTTNVETKITNEENQGDFVITTPVTPNSIDWISKAPASFSDEDIPF